MRMIGIGLMGFLLAGVALLLSTMNILEQGQRYVRDITSGPQLLFEHRIAATAEDLHTAAILRANPDHPVILSGLPAYQSVAFIMPVDARPTSGYLQIDATSQVLDGVEGVLRISIRNTRRGEMLLRSGEVGRSLQIPLSPMDFAGNQLVVSFSLQGTDPQQQCPQDGGIAAVVEIETTSAVFLTLDRPMISARDQIHAWGNVVRVAWPSWLQQDEQVRRLVLAVKFKRRNLTTIFSRSKEVGGLTTVGLRDALTAFPEPVVQPHVRGLSAPDLGLRRFHRTATWRVRYDLGRGTGQLMPASFDLHMQFGRLLDDQFWALAVMLNNRLVLQTHISGSQPAFGALIDLPPEMQSATNTLEVVATTTKQHDGICHRGPEVVAEMLPTTRLVTGDTAFADPLTKVRAALNRMGVINIGANGTMSALDADIASEMLNRMIPEHAEFKPAGRKSHVTVLLPGHLSPTLPDTGHAWLVTQDSTLRLSVQPLKPGDLKRQTGIALLITPTAITLPEAEG